MIVARYLLVALLLAMVLLVLFQIYHVFMLALKEKKDKTEKVQKESGLSAQDPWAGIKNGCMLLVGFMFWVGLGVFLYTTFIEGWGSTSGGYDSGDIGCSRAGDCW